MDSGSKCHFCTAQILAFLNCILCKGKSFLNYYQPLPRQLCLGFLRPSRLLTSKLNSAALLPRLHPSSHPSFTSLSFIRPSSSYLSSSRLGFLGPKSKRKYLVLRGFIGSNAMILLYYAVQQMPLADATVIMFR